MRAGRTGQADGALRAGRTGQANGALRAGRTGQADGALRAGRTGQADGALRAGRTSHADGALRAGRTGQADGALRAGRAGGPGETLSAGGACQAHGTLGSGTAQGALSAGVALEALGPDEGSPRRPGSRRLGAEQHAGGGIEIEIAVQALGQRIRRAIQQGLAVGARGPGGAGRARVAGGPRQARGAGGTRRAHGADAALEAGGTLGARCARRAGRSGSSGRSEQGHACRPYACCPGSKEGAGGGVQVEIPIRALGHRIREAIEDGPARDAGRPGSARQALSTGGARQALRTGGAGQALSTRCAGRAGQALGTRCADRAGQALGTRCAGQADGALTAGRARLAHGTLGAGIAQDPLGADVALEALNARNALGPHRPCGPDEGSAGRPSACRLGAEQRAGGGIEIEIAVHALGHGIGRAVQQGLPIGACGASGARRTGTSGGARCACQAGCAGRSRQANGALKAWRPLEADAALGTRCARGPGRSGGTGRSQQGHACRPHTGGPGAEEGAGGGVEEEISVRPLAHRVRGSTEDGPARDAGRSGTAGCAGQARDTLSAGGTRQSRDTVSAGGTRRARDALSAGGTGEAHGARGARRARAARRAGRAGRTRRSGRPRGPCRTYAARAGGHRARHPGRAVEDQTLAGQGGRGQVQGHALEAHDPGVGFRPRDVTGQIAQVVPGGLGLEGRDDRHARVHRLAVHGHHERQVGGAQHGGRDDGHVVVAQGRGVEACRDGHVLGA